MKTRKLLVSVNYQEFRAKKEEYIVPFSRGSGDDFLGIKSGATYPYGMVVFVGKEITVNDVFSMLVDSGRKIADVDATLTILALYLEALHSFKIGNIVSVSYSDNRGGFSLSKEASSNLKKSKSKLP